ncbi:MAG: DUF1499 domain-containing protein [Gammaproteobacteria bacterium]|jgi:uncharacterized protein (DUF1499 family)|nr:DUF1499 domain-containing protein [Gammaproteobacteria bacterium]
MAIATTLNRSGLFIIMLMSLLSCSGQRPANLGISDNKLATCQPSPNCVSSDATDETHRVRPLAFNLRADDAWEIAQQTVSEMPRTRIVSLKPDYLHAESSSAVFGFVDDLELHLRPDENIIAIRSASRLGHSDFGVNRDRVEKLRAAFVKQAGSSD